VQQLQATPTTDFLLVSQRCIHLVKDYKTAFYCFFKNGQNITRV